MSGECDNCGHHTTECCCHEPIPEPNPFQNFNDAMDCVLRGGKAWRAEEGDHCRLWQTHPKPTRLGDMNPFSRITPDDLTATDWVWEEAS